MVDNPRINSGRSVGSARFLFTPRHSIRQSLPLNTPAKKQPEPTEHKPSIELSLTAGNTRQADLISRQKRPAINRQSEPGEWQPNLVKTDLETEIHIGQLKLKPPHPRTDLTQL